MTPTPEPFCACGHPDCDGSRAGCRSVAWIRANAPTLPAVDLPPDERASEGRPEMIAATLEPRE